MQLKILCVLIFFISVSSAPEELYENKSFKIKHARNKRSLKNAFPKNEYAETPGVSSVRNQVFLLETSVEAAKGKLKKISEQNQELKKSMREQKELLQIMVGEFSDLENQLSAHGYLLNDFEEAAIKTNYMFASSNHTCGGVLVGHAGSILFSRPSKLSNPPTPSVVSTPCTCVWTIQASNYAFIKVSMLHTLVNGYSYIPIYVLEMNETHATGNRYRIPLTKITKLQKNSHNYVVAGPTIFVVASLLYSADIDLHIQFEGTGKVVERSTFFTHEILQADPVGSFNNSELKSWSPSLLETLDGKTNYTLDHTTIVVSNFSTLVHLQVAIGNGGCSNGESFIVISDVKEHNNASATDCCKVDCRGKDMLVNYRNPFFILITKKFQQPFNFNLTWSADPIYPSTNDDWNYCGGVLGGPVGILTYKPNRNYRNNERCIWVIVPQPQPAPLSIKVESYRISDPDDRLYIVELTDLNGEELPDAPKITRLSYYNTAKSREVYIIFYSDFALYEYGAGFSLRWNVLDGPDLSKNSSDISTQFTHLNLNNGTATIDLRKETFTSSLYQVFMFTPYLPSTYISGLQLKLDQKLPLVVGASDCFLNELSVFIPFNGTLIKTALECNDFGEAIIQNADGMVLAVMKSQNNVSSKTEIDFKWEKDIGEENRTEVVVGDNKCGGIILASKGVLNYQTKQTFLSYVRCVWLLYAPNSTNIFLKLDTVGFIWEDEFLVTPIDPHTGTLTNFTKRFGKADRSHTTNGSMMAIVFGYKSPYHRSDITGFSLRFLSRGSNPHSEFNYKLRHISDSHGTVDYDTTPGTNNDIYVIGWSMTPREYGGPTESPMSIDWSKGVFRKANDSCANYDSLVFYEPIMFNDGSWLKVAQFPIQNNDTSCPDVVNVPEKKDILSLTHSAFIAIYKPVVGREGLEIETQKRFQFDYHVEMVHSKCGGSVDEDYGRISYKEKESYRNNERCDWEVEIPQAEMIAFTLERNRLEQGDVVTVSPDRNSNGVPLTLLEHPMILVRGNKAIVHFNSNSESYHYRPRFGFRIRYEKINSTNPTCGGVLIGNSGSIVFSRPASEFINDGSPSSCVWTVRANESALIKVSVGDDPTNKVLSPSSFISNTFVLEILKTNATGNLTSLNTPQIKMTEMRKPSQHVFAGPIIFVVTPFIPQKYIDFHLQFEGMGDLVGDITYFTHETLLANSHNFSSRQLATWNSSLLKQPNDNINFTLDYTTILVSNFSTKLYLQATVGNCSNEESFIIMTNVMQNNSSGATDCCQTNCKETLMNYDDPLIILISKRFQQTFNFNITWEADPNYPSSNNRSGLVSKCGEVLGGTNGTIKYKALSPYGNNERCIWVIIPQPRPTSSIIIKYVRSGISRLDDKLYMMELTDINGELLPDAPKITRLSNYGGPYEAYSREVYIVFYSNFDNSSGFIREGFSLHWNAVGEAITTGNDLTTKFIFFESSNGTATNAWNKFPFIKRLYQVFIFTPSIQSIYNNGMQLTLDTTLSSESNCTNIGLIVFAAVDGLLTKTQPKCNNPGEAILKDMDGMAVILMSSQHNSSSEIAIDYKWTDEYENEKNMSLIDQDDKCGGVWKMRRTNGLLRYKQGSRYERCVWLLYSPNSTTITLKLISNSGFLRATTINPETGDLRNNTVIINRANKTRTFEDEVVVLLYQTDTGFVLHFSALGDNSHKYDFKLRHVSELNGTLQFPDSNWYNDGSTGKKDVVYVMAANIVLNRQDNDRPYRPIAIDWSGGVFQKAKNDSCTYDSLTLYKIKSTTSWVSQALLPKRIISSCSDVVTVPGKKKIFSTDVPVFLVIYKPIPVESNHTSLSTSSFQLDYQLMASSYDCGGEFVGPYGYIMYKQFTSYNNNENCVWQIQVPQAKSISFHLEEEGLEKCCDHIAITSNESPRPIMLGPTNGIVTVSGSTANVTFTSDSTVIGSGFRISFENSTDAAVEGDNCGGVIITRGVGVLNYKLGTYYLNNERCVWLLHSPNSESITLELVEDGFEPHDSLLVNTINPNTGVLKNDTIKINHENNTRIFEESVVVIVFYSDQTIRGKGFSLQFSTVGNNPNPAFVYKLRHTSNADGTVTYPSAEWSDGESANNEQLFVLAHSVHGREEEEPSAVNLRWISGVFHKSNESCDYDSLKFYTTPSSIGWRTRETFLNDTSSCPDVVVVPPNKNLFSADYPSFLAIYKPISAGQIQENFTHFVFSYNESKGCGGVYIENSGEISFKEDGTYSNNEQCVWLIEVPRAEKISFHLEMGGFEECCDHLTVSSVSYTGRIDYLSTEMTSTKAAATVNGPVAIVAFTSDSSVVGRGFRLVFNASVQATEDYPYVYSLAHTNQPGLVQFSQQVESNQIAIFAYAHYFKFNSQVDITSFRPQVNESCYSDELKIYGMRLTNKDFVFDLEKTFSAERSSQNGTDYCTIFDNGQFNSCESFGDCDDAPDGNILRLGTTSYVAIYYSVNVSSSLRFRGFSLTSEVMHS